MDQLTATLLSAPVLFFVLGALAAAARSDLSVPETIAKGMSLYLMAAIGLKGGVEVAKAGIGPELVTALAAGLAAVQDQDHVAQSRSHNDKWLKRLAKEMPKIGIEMLPSVCNFVLLRFAEDSGRNAKEADAFLIKCGILARNVDNYHLPDCLRIGIGQNEEMDALLSALKKFMA